MARFDGEITRMEFRDGKLERFWAEDAEGRTSCITIINREPWPPLPINARGLHALVTVNRPGITIEVPDG